MFQQRGANVSAPATPNQQESDRAFLERNGVPQMMRGLLNKLVETRPADPLAAMADYFAALHVNSTRKRRRVPLFACENFASIDVPSASVVQARRHLESAAWHAPAFLFHLNAAYETLAEVQQDRGGAGRPRMRAVSGELVNELVAACLGDAALADRFARRVRLKPFWFVPFDVFRYLLTAACIFKEFTALAASLFEDLAAAPAEGREERSACKAVLRLLEDSLCMRDKASPKSVLTATRNLSALEVDKLLTRKAAGPTAALVAPTRDEFVETAAERFLDGLAPVQ